MEVIEQKVMKNKHKVMYELKLFRDWLESFERELPYFSHEILEQGKR